MAWSPCDGWVTGRDPNVNVNVNVLSVFVEDKKFDSKLVRFNLHIRRLQRFCLHLRKNLHFCSAFVIRLLVYQDK